jgi:hypothetical protein
VSAFKFLLPPLVPQGRHDADQSDRPSVPWQKMLGDRLVRDDQGDREGGKDQSVSRVLRLTLLVPALVEAILDDRLIAGLTLTEAMEPFPVTWSEQTMRSTRRQSSDMGEARRAVSSR